MSARLAAPGIWRLPLGSVNAYALRTTAGTALVDAGNPGDGPRILAMLSAAGLQPPALVLLTHGDVDHAGGVRGLVAACSAAVYAPAGEAEVLAGRGRPSWVRRLSRLLTGRVGLTGALEEGARQAGLAVVPTPGHTPGHCSLLRASDGVLFAGDALTVHGTTVHVPRRPFTDDPGQARSSVERLGRLRVRLLLPGHGDPLPEPGAAIAAALARPR